MSRFQKSLYILFSFIFAACSPASTQTPAPDFASLLQSSCFAPCWNDITPGVTTKSQLIDTIPSLPFYKSSAIAWASENWQQVTQNAPETPNSTAVIMIGKNWAGISIDIKDSVVSAITFDSILNKSRQYNDLNLTLDNALKLYGTPTYILKGGSFASFKCENLYAIYPKQGIILVAESQDFVEDNGFFPTSIRILPELPVRKVVLFTPSYLKDFPSNLEVGNIRCEFDTEPPQWQGYTTVDFSKIGSSCD